MANRQQRRAASRGQARAARNGPEAPILSRPAPVQPMPCPSSWNVGIVPGDDGRPVAVGVQVAHPTGTVVLFLPADQAFDIAKELRAAGRKVQGEPAEELLEVPTPGLILPGR